MSDSTIDHVKSYAAVAQRHKDGLDAIITSIGTGGPGTVTIDDLMNAVYDYLESVYTDIGADPQGEESIRALIANAINGYLNNGSSSPYLKNLQRVPPLDLSNQFDRLFDATRAIRQLKSNTSRQQITLAIGEANVEYWLNQMSTSGDWTNYMTGDGAINVAAMPYWTDAAMFGTQFDYYQNNATDSQAVGSVIISSLAGSLVVGAGKVVFGWAPKPVKIDTSMLTKLAAGLAGHGQKPTNPITGQPVIARCYEFCCDNGVEDSFDASNDAEADAMITIISGIMGVGCSITSSSD